jgi:molecular chaperone GrpE
MSTEDRGEKIKNQQDEFDLDTDGIDDLESVMQEALDAVEKADVDLEPSSGVLGDGDSESSGSQNVDEPEVSNLEAQISELRESSIRTMADFDNFRKRAERERAEERRYAASDVLKEFIKIIDNLERAVSSEGPEDDFRTGVELILRQMHDLLRQSGVSRVEALGKEFDPRYHEAVSKHESAEVTTPTVSREMQPGYLLQDRLLRPAIVQVAMPAEGGPEPSAAPKGGLNN